MFKKMLTLSLLLTSLSALSQNDIALGEPAYGGNGCPNGSASVTISPDAKTLSIIFDQFITEAGPSSGRTLDRKSCNVAVPVHVPNGVSISVLAVDYRGFVSLPSASSSARLQAEYFFAGMMGPRFIKDFRGRSEQDYLFNNTLGVQAVVWSPCGADVNLRVNASMMVRNTSGLDALATVDSADISAGIIYQIQMRRCH